MSERYSRDSRYRSESYQSSGGRHHGHPSHSRREDSYYSPYHRPDDRYQNSWEDSPQRDWQEGSGRNHVGHSRRDNRSGHSGREYRESDWGHRHQEDRHSNYDRYSRHNDYNDVPEQFRRRNDHPQSRPSEPYPSTLYPPNQGSSSGEVVSPTKEDLEMKIRDVLKRANETIMSQSKNRSLSMVPTAAMMSSRAKSRSPPPSTVAMDTHSLRPEIPKPPIAPKLAKSSMPVPNPTPEYLHFAAQPAHNLEKECKILLILDLNETLVTRTKGGSVNLRPHLHKFLQYIFQHFYVMVWSSAQPVNVAKMIGAAFPRPLQDSLVAVWARDMFGLTPAQYNAKVTTYKDLSKIWGKIPGPSPDVMWGQSNTILIDDSKEKARAQPYNHIELPPYERRPEDENEEVLLELMEYLDGLRFTDNVSSYIRENPFVSVKNGANFLKEKALVGSGAVVGGGGETGGSKKRKKKKSKSKSKSATDTTTSTSSMSPK